MSNPRTNFVLKGTHFGDIVNISVLNARCWTIFVNSIFGKLFQNNTYHELEKSDHALSRHRYPVRRKVIQWANSLGHFTALPRPISIIIHLPRVAQVRTPPTKTPHTQNQIIHHSQNGQVHFRLLVGVHKDEILLPKQRFAVGNVVADHHKYYGCVFRLDV